jgi:hypothetical protein
MSDTETKPRPATEIVGKLSPAALGVPQAALSDDTVNKATMGQIFGQITGIVRRTKKDDVTGETQKLRGFRGSFIAIPNDTKRPEKRSSVLYLPEGLAGGLLDRFDAADSDGEVISANVALELFVERAKNPAGYSWGGRSMLPDDGVNEDPAAEVMRLAGVAPRAAIAAPSGDGESVPAASDAKVKAKA